MTTKRYSIKRKREIYRNERRHEKNVKRKNKFQSFNAVQLKERANEIRKDQQIILRLKEKCLERFGYLITPGSGDLIITIPEVFCICNNYKETFKTIKLFASSLYDYTGHDITIDFSQCKKVDTAALFLMQILRLELLEILSHLQSRLSLINVVPEIGIKAPKTKDAIRLLLIAGFPVSEQDIKDLDDDSTLTPIHNMGYLKGSKSQRHYLENKKSVFTAEAVEYLNSCLKLHGYELTSTTTNSIDGIIGEVLSNAEDHGGTNYWYLTGNFSKELLTFESEEIGEMNLTIMNFGNSIYEAFVDTKRDNMEMFNQVQNYSQTILNKHPQLSYSEEQLFLFATMQEQISRLKFERESRGTGTMKFINSFLEIGDFEKPEKGYIPNLSIFSGNVHMICDNKFKPFLKDNVYCLSLNAENDLSLPPSGTHLRKLNDKFPGTLLSVKIYINKKHWDKKYGGNSHERSES